MMQGQERRCGPASPEARAHQLSFARPLAVRLALVAGAALAFAGFAALGTWQLYRLQWKLALIERGERRVHAAAVPAPGRERWPHISAESDEYRHVRVSGTFLYDLTTRVQATTELGSGYWLLTPLRTADGSAVLINRGFIRAPEPRRDASADNRLAARADRNPVTITGLLRISEPGGAFLRRNNPAGNRWYSRDVRAIAAARGLSDVASYFVDADAGQNAAAKGLADASPDRPVSGLTVISFHNNHLVYAITWYALALMTAGAFVWAAREESGSQRSAGRLDDVERENEHGGKI